jgi:hypothetical protein
MGKVELSATNQGVHKNEHSIQHQEVGQCPEHRFRHHCRLRRYGFVLRVRAGFGTHRLPGVRHHCGPCFEQRGRRRTHQVAPVLSQGPDQTVRAFIFNKIIVVSLIAF